MQLMPHCLELVRVIFGTSGPVVKPFTQVGVDVCCLCVHPVCHCWTDPASCTAYSFVSVLAPFTAPAWPI